MVVAFEKSVTAGNPGTGADGTWPGLAVLPEPTGIATVLPCAVKLMLPSML